MKLNEGDKVKVFSHRFNGTVGVVTALHLKDVSVEFEDGEEEE